MVWILVVLCCAVVGAGAVIAVLVMQVRELAIAVNDVFARCKDAVESSAPPVMSEPARVAKRSARPFRARKSFWDERVEFERHNNGRKDDREVGEAL